MNALAELLKNVLENQNNELEFCLSKSEQAPWGAVHKICAKKPTILHERVEVSLTYAIVPI